MTKSENIPSGDQPDPFGSTRWSVVLAAAGDGDSARAALETLCRTYWLPVYGYVRSRSANRDDAYDLTQGFFADLLQRNTFAAANPARGKFRAFLLASLKNYLLNQHARQSAMKRGGGQLVVSLDRDLAEDRLSRPHGSKRTPEQEFERRWAIALLDRVIECLSAEQAAAGREREFTILRPFLTGQSPGAAQTDIALSLQMTPEAVRAAVYRLRKRYRVLLRNEVAQTVESSEDVDEELRRLISAVSS